MAKTEIETRNRRIIKEYKSGEKLMPQLAEENNLSTERISQIIKEKRVVSKPTERDQLIKDNIKTIKESLKSKTLAEVAEDYNMTSAQFVRRLYKLKVRVGRKNRVGRKQGR